MMLEAVRMKILVIYDSVFGNTERIAREIGKALGSEVPVILVGKVTPADLSGLDVLLVGSPTRGFKPTPAITGFIEALPANSLKGVRVSAFDTRIPLETIKSRLFRAIVKRGGYADKIIAESLVRKGGELALPTGGFFVTASEGPLQKGELERAAEWAKGILTA